MNDTGKICGAGDRCEDTCPVMRMGRICPDVLDAVEEALEPQLVA
jgi:hypothetical protein